MSNHHALTLYCGDQHNSQNCIVRDGGLSLPCSFDNVTLQTIMLVSCLQSFVEYMMQELSAHDLNIPVLTNLQEGWSNYQPE